MPSSVGIQPKTDAVKPSVAYAPPSEAIKVTQADIPRLQTIINAAPNGATIQFTAGIYRNMPRLTLKSGMKILGSVSEAGDITTIFNGSVVLSNWRKEDNGTWSTAYNRISVFEPHGSFESGYEGNGFLHPLYLNGKFLQRKRTVAELATAGPNWWAWDYTQNRIYTTTDPATGTYELGIQSYPFSYGAGVDNVTISAIHFTQYANHAQMGVLGGQTPQGKNWVIDYCTVSLSHGLGINAGAGWTVKKCRALYNGFSGIGSGSNVRRSNVTISNCESAYNNQLYFGRGWDAGGGKFSTTDNLTVTECYYHHNHGRGIWTDIENINCTITHNVCEYNYNEGIMHEISHDALIANNLCRFNSKEFNWLYGPQILISASNNVRVERNLCEVHPDYGLGISVLTQERGTSRLTGQRYVSSNASLTENVIVYRNTTTRSNWPAATMFGYDTRVATDDPTLTAQLKNNKHYIQPNARKTVLYWKNRYVDPTSLNLSEVLTDNAYVVDAEYGWVNGTLQPVKEVITEDETVYQTTLDALKLENSKLQASVADLTKAVEDATAKLKQTSTELAALQQSLADTKNQLAERDATIVNIQQSIAIKNKTISDLTTKVSNLEASLATALGENRSLNEKLISITQSKAVEKAAMLDDLLSFKKKLDALNS